MYLYVCSVHVHVYMRDVREGEEVNVSSFHGRMCVCMCICVCMGVSICVHVFACVYDCVQVCIHCVCVCVYVLCTQVIRSG